MQFNLRFYLRILRFTANCNHPRHWVLSCWLHDWLWHVQAATSQCYTAPLCRHWRI